jgi:uncharacterized protein YjiK
VWARIAVTGVTTALCLAGMSTSASAAPTETADLIRVTRTSTWRSPSPDPTGLTYSRSTNKLMVVDAEIDELGRIFKRSNMFIATIRGRFVRRRSVIRTSPEPEDIAWRNRSSVFVVDDDRDKVFRVKAGPDGRIGTADDRHGVTLRTRRFGCRDPEGLAWRRETRSLFLTDEDGGRVFHVRPGRDRRLGTRDDRVVRFASRSVGLPAPEGVEFDPRTNHLLIVGGGEDLIAETTLRGRLIRWIDISEADIVNASDVTLVPDRSDPSGRRIIVADKGVDPDADRRENDGRLLRFAYPA